MSFIFLIVTTNGVDQHRGAANVLYMYNSDGYETGGGVSFSVPGEKKSIERDYRGDTMTAILFFFDRINLNDGEDCSFRSLYTKR